MNYNDNGEVKQITVKAGDTLPVGTEVDFNGTTIPAGWEEVPTIGENAKIVYKNFINGSGTDTYTFEDDSLYFVIASTNGDETCIFDIVHTSAGSAYHSRIKGTSTAYKTISYSANTLTMTNTYYKGIYVIMKLY